MAPILEQEPGEREQSQQPSLRGRFERITGIPSLANLGREMGRQIRERAQTKADIDLVAAILKTTKTLHLGTFMDNLNHDSERDDGLAQFQQAEYAPLSHYSGVIYHGENSENSGSNGDNGDGEDFNVWFSRLPRDTRAAYGALFGGLGGGLASFVLARLYNDAKNAKGLSRRLFLRMSATAGVGAFTAGCAAANWPVAVATEAIKAPTDQPKPKDATATRRLPDPPPPPEPTPNPEKPKFNRMNARQIDPWSKVLALSVGETDNRNIRAPLYNSPDYPPIVSTRSTENAVILNDTSYEFNNDYVRVNLPFDGDPTNTGVYSNGMLWLPHPYDTVTVKDVRGSNVQVENQTLTKLASAKGLAPNQIRWDGTNSVGNLNGHALRWGVWKGNEHQGYLSTPWLTGEKVISEYDASDGNNSQIVYFEKSAEGAKGKEIGRVSLDQVTILLKDDVAKKEEDVVLVSADGRYMVYHQKYDDKHNAIASSRTPTETLAKRLNRETGLNESVARIYNEVYMPHITGGEWAIYKEGEPRYNEKLKGKVDPGKMFAVTGAIDKAHRKTLDLNFGTLQVALNTGEEISPDANHRTEKIKHAKAIEGQAELRVQLLRIRDNLSSQHQGEVDFRNFTVVVEKTSSGYSATQAIAKVKEKDPADGSVKNTEVRYKIDEKGSLSRILLAREGKSAEVREKEFNLLPELKTEGALLKRTDTGEVIELKGVNISNWAYEKNVTFDAPNNQSLWTRGLKTIINENWPINFFRVGLNLQYYSSQFAELDKLVDFAERQGIYIMFEPHREGDSKQPQPFLPGKGTDKMMAEFAARYKNRNHVMYELFNEPAPENQMFAEMKDWNKFTMLDAVARWRQVAQPIADAIRTANPDALIVVPGHTRYASELYDYLDHPFSVNGSNDKIIYDAHVYGHLEDPSQMPYANNKSAHQFAEASLAPLVFGEVGGVAVGFATPNLVEADNKYTQDELNYLNTKPGAVHLTTQSLDAWDDSGIFTVASKWTVPTPRGAIFKADYFGKSPYDFRN